MTETVQPKAGFLRRVAALLSPSREHSITSAAFLLMGATLLSRVVGALRETYVAYAFGAGPVTDAYVAAFTLPDLLNYMASGGAISISFISIYTRYLTEKREEDARHAFSVIISVMGVGFAALIVVAELAAPWFVHWLFKGFSEEQAAQCIYLTRILLPAQLFFLLGGVVSAVQQTRRQFLIPAFAPIIYTVFIIGGGLMLSRPLGIASLAYGAVAGCIAGPFLLNAIGAQRTGIGFTFRFLPSDPAFREWLWMSVPLMLGVSIIVADDWIMRHFATAGEGAITRINYAKRLLQVPIGILGQAVGVASLPFFARLYSEQKHDQFAQAVNQSITKLASVSLLASAWMVSAALPIVDIAFRRGMFDEQDAWETALYFSWFSLALVFWTVQGLYARAFFAARDMVRPMVAATLVTLCSFPIYGWLFREYGVVGLAIASNIAIFIHTVTLAALLHQRKLILLTGLGWIELAKALATATLAFFFSVWVGGAFENGVGRATILMRLAMISLTWGAAVAAGLFITRSTLLKGLRRSG